MNGARNILLVVSSMQIVASVAFFLQLPVVVGLWPFPGTTPLSFIFVASIFAAAAAATLWAVLTENYGALAGIGLDYLVILTPLSILALQLGARDGSAHMTAFGFACAIGALGGLGLMLWSRRFPMDETLPMPAAVRVSFFVFIAALLIVATRLISQSPYAFPWSVTPDLSAVIGWMFAGAAAYFAYGLLRPSWINAAGQLLGFLAYDVVLIVPFLERLREVSPYDGPGLTIYTSIVVLSGLLAIYYLFLHEPTRTRTWRRAGAHLR